MEKNIQVIAWSMGFFVGIERSPLLEILVEQIHTWPRYRIPVIVARGHEPPVLVPMRWGIRPFYARGPSQYITNARSDGILSKATWKQSAARRRCLVPVSGYYEPGLGAPGARGEVRFSLRDQPAFFIAGLWDRDPDDNDSHGFAIVTAEANDFAKRFHDRMPVVLFDDDAREWIGNHPLPPERVVALCRSCTPEIMVHQEIPAVSKGKVSKDDLPPPNGELLL